MPTSRFIPLSAAASLILAPTAHAAFTGLTVHSSVSEDGTRSIHRVFASFDHRDDRVIIWGTGDPSDPEILLSSASAGSIIIRNIAADGVSPGSGFLNAQPNGSNSLPSSSAPSPSDSYYTIGTDVQDYPPASLPWLLNIGMPSLGTPAAPGPANLAQITASGQILSFVMTPEGVVNPASNAGSLHDGDPTGVLLAQFAVSAGEHVHGTLGVVWRPAGATTGFIVESNLAFTTIPAPGALSLLGIAAMIASRRHRRTPLSLAAVAREWGRGEGVLLPCWRECTFVPFVGCASPPSPQPSPSQQQSGDADCLYVGRAPVVPAQAGTASVPNVAPSAPGCPAARA